MSIIFNKKHKKTCDTLEFVNRSDAVIISQCKSYISDKFSVFKNTMFHESLNWMKRIFSL